jgi:hypothetical protein
MPREMHASLGWGDTDGMVAQVFLQVGQTQNQLEQLFALRRRLGGRVACECEQGGVGAVEEPVEQAGVQLASLAAEPQGFMDPGQTNLKEMIETEQFPCQ